MGHTIRINAMDLLGNDVAAFSDFEVLIGDSTHTQDFTRTSNLDDTVCNTQLEWNVGVKFAVQPDMPPFKTAENGDVTFHGHNYFKDTRTGWKTVYWGLVIYRQTNGLITDWDDDNIEEERDLIDSDSGDWYYQAPIDWQWLDGYGEMILTYDPPDPVETTFYMMVYAYMSTTGTTETSNVLWYNIPVTVEY